MQLAARQARATWKSVCGPVMTYGIVCFNFSLSLFTRQNQPANYREREGNREALAVATTSFYTMVCVLMAG